MQQYLVEKIVKEHPELVEKTFRIGFEDAVMTVETYRTLEALFEKMNLKQWELVPLHKKLDKMRRIKTPEEIESIKKAEKIGDEAFTKVTDWLTKCYREKTSVTEKQVAAHIEFYMRDAGAEGTSFSSALPYTIVRVISEQYPLTRQPKSIVRKSPSSSTLSVGTACDKAGDDRKRG